VKSSPPYSGCRFDYKFHKTVLCALTLLSQSFSSPIHPTDVAELTRDADVIVVARATKVSSQGKGGLALANGTVPAERYVAQLKIDRVLKGKVDEPLLSVQFFLPDALVGMRGVVEGEYAVFFLKSAATGFIFLDPVRPSLPAIPDSVSPSGDTLDQVTTALAQVLNSSGSSKSEFAVALDALARLNTPLAGQKLRDELSNPDPDRSLRIAITLVGRSDIGGLDKVENALRSPDAVSPELVQDAAGCLAGMKDPKAIPSLSRLLTLNNPEINRGVAVALRQTGSTSALPPLSKLLNDRNPMTRYYAVIGFGEITHRDDWAPAFPEFQQNPARYVSYWQTWAEKNLH